MGKYFQQFKDYITEKSTANTALEKSIDDFRVSDDVLNNMTDDQLAYTYKYADIQSKSTIISKKRRNYEDWKEQSFYVLRTRGKQSLIE